MEEDPALFDRRADAYERGRPAYPQELYECLADHGLMHRGLRVLDLGAGTGQATGEFVRAGAVVTAVEPGPQLADRIRAKWPDVEVLEARWEDVTLPPKAFDAAVCATALHWVDLDRGLPRLWEALVEGGPFAAWWNVFGDPARTTPFREQLRTVTAAGPATPPRTHPSPVDADHWVAALTQGGWFALQDSREFRWSTVLTSDQVHDLFSTFSGWSDAEVDAAASAVEGLGGSVEEHYRTVLYVCRARH